jgi:hypothetical protein
MIVFLKSLLAGGKPAVNAAAELGKGAFIWLARQVHPLSVRPL